MNISQELLGCETVQCFRLHRNYSVNNTSNFPVTSAKGAVSSRSAISKPAWPRNGDAFYPEPDGESIIPSGIANALMSRS